MAAERRLEVEEQLNPVVEPYNPKVSKLSELSRTKVYHRSKMIKQHHKAPQGILRSQFRSTYGVTGSIGSISGLRLMQFHLLLLECCFRF